MARNNRNPTNANIRRASQRWTEAEEVALAVAYITVQNEYETVGERPTQQARTYVHFHRLLNRTVGHRSTDAVARKLRHMIMSCRRFGQIYHSNEPQTPNPTYNELMEAFEETKDDYWATYMEWFKYDSVWQLLRP